MLAFHILPVFLSAPDVFCVIDTKQFPVVSISCVSLKLYWRTDKYMPLRLCLHHFGRTEFISGYFYSTLKMEATCVFEMLITIYQITCHILLQRER
jgi:hypothetical protein